MAIDVSFLRRVGNFFSIREGDGASMQIAKMAAPIIGVLGVLALTAWAIKKCFFGKTGVTETSKDVTQFTEENPAGIRDKILSGETVEVRKGREGELVLSLSENFIDEINRFWKSYLETLYELGPLLVQGTTKKIAFKDSDVQYEHIFRVFKEGRPYHLKCVTTRTSGSSTVTGLSIVKLTN